MTQTIAMNGELIDRNDSLKGPLLTAIILHATLIGAVALSGWIGERQAFGDPNAGGGAVGVEAVDKIPLQHEGPQNPLANESQSQVPQTPVTKPVDREKAPKPDPDAVPLKNRETKRKLAEQASVHQQFRNYDELKKNQLTTQQAPQVSSNLYSAQPGSGRIGTGANTTLGSQFAGYAAQIQQLVAQHWRTSDVDPNIQKAPVVIATFELLRDGSIRNVQILQASGVSSLDNSVRRAILDASPFPPIPPAFPKDYARVEFWFELKR
jgi:TonB family protein